MHSVHVVVSLFGQLGPEAFRRGPFNTLSAYSPLSHSKPFKSRLGLLVSLLVLLCGHCQPSALAAEHAADAPLTAANQKNLSIKPDFVTLTLQNTMSQDAEIVQWPDGGFSVPVKTFATLLDIDAQLSESEKRLFWIDPQTGQTVELYWEQNRLLMNGQEVPVGPHAPVRLRGLLINDDVYLDQAAFSQLFQVTFKLDKENTTLDFSTSRKLRLPTTDNTAASTSDMTLNARVIRTPEISRNLVDKIYLQHSSNYGYQVSRQPVGTRNQIDNTYFSSLVDTSTVGIRGSLLGLDYYVKPSIIRFNKKANFERVDWSIQHEGKNNIISLGSTDAGLSTLTTPSLNIWGLKLASKNATGPTLFPQQGYEFSGKAGSGNQVIIRVNDRTVQTVTAQDDTYELEPVYLQPQAMSHIQIFEKDSQNQEKLLVDKTVGNFSSLLPKGEAGYSAFAGRVPLQFHPLIPDLKTPILMPQSEKWLAGGRLFYGLGHRMTVGVSAAGDHIFGKPETYFTSLNPYSVDLTGFSSYQRDANFFSGENTSVTMRYQLTDRWLATADLGMSRMRLKSGTLLHIPDSSSGKAAQLHLERQGSLLSWYVDAFHYDPYYYTPTASLYGNTLYDKRGLGAGVNGTVSKFLTLNYNVNWSHYQTNLERLIPGGLINVERWGGTLSTQLNNNNYVAATFNWVKGTNHEREFIQRFLDIDYRTQSLPWGIQGQIKASHYYTNTLFLPSKTLGTELLETPYINNILDTSLDIPINRRRQTHVKIGNRLSSFVNYGYIQGFFRYKQLFMEPVAQASYGDRPQTQNRYGLKLGYEFKSGARISVAYYKIASSFQPGLGISVRPTIKTDQFYVDFADVLGLLGHRLTSLGPGADTAGMITGILFVDYKSNGKPDKTEPGIQGVKLIIDKSRVMETDKSGQYQVSGLSAGYHTLEVLPDALPLTISAENPIYRIKVREGKKHRVDIALMPEGGVLKGRLELVDTVDKSMNPKHIILVLRNERGDSVKYTSVDEQGRYKFSNVPAGRYSIDLEARMKASGRYKILAAPSSVELNIPRHYSEIQEIPNLNLKLLAL